MTTLTPESQEVFVRHGKDFYNWSGTIMLEITQAEKGNLTDLKRKGLLDTFIDEGIEWVQFTTKGYDLLEKFGVEIDHEDRI